MKTNNNIVNLLAAGNHSSAVVTSFRVDKTEEGKPYVCVMFRCGNHLVPFYGMLTRNKEIPRDARYYTLLSLSRIGYTEETASTFAKDCIGQVADVEVEHYESKKGVVKAKVARIYANAESPLSLTDVLGDDLGITENKVETTEVEFE